MVYKVFQGSGGEGAGGFGGGTQGIEGAVGEMYSYNDLCQDGMQALSAGVKADDGRPARVRIWQLPAGGIRSPQHSPLTPNLVHTAATSR